MYWRTLRTHATGRAAPFISEAPYLNSAPYLTQHPIFIKKWKCNPMNKFLDFFGHDKKLDGKATIDIIATILGYRTHSELKNVFHTNSK